MKIFGSITELISAVFRKNSQTITVRPNQATTYTAARDVQLPEGDTSHVVVSRTSTDTLTNKTLTAPAISSPTGLVKADVGLGNVDNTSDATKNAATATLTNKTLTSPVINSPTGIVKGDVGLGNVDNTSDATKNAASVTLTNKTLTSPVINSPTGIVKGDVGLGNVDNTSDATKNSATVQLTNKDIDGGTASNTSRVTLPKAGTATLAALTRKEGTIAYDTDLDKVVVDNGSAFSALSGGTGAGELNAVLNASASDALTGWTDGTSHTTTRVTSGSPLDPVITTALSTSASTTASESSTSGVKYSISTMPSSLTNKKLKVEFYFTTEASQTWAVSVYASTTRLALSSDSSGTTLLPAGTTGKFVAYFDTTSATAYSVNLTRTAGSGTAVLKFTNVIVGPGIQPQGAVVGEPINYTPVYQGFGAASTDGISYQRIGSMMKVFGRISVGTATAVEARLGIVSPFTIGAQPSGGTNQVCGKWWRNEPSGAARKTGTIIAQSGLTYVTFGSDDYTSANVPATSLNGSSFVSDQILYVEFYLPIAEWAGSGTVNLAQNDVEYAWNSNTTTSLGNGGSDTSSFGYGPEGIAIASFTTSGINSPCVRRVRFATPIQATDILNLELKVNNSWINWTDKYVTLTLNDAGTTRYGVDMQPVSGSTTEVDVRFYGGGPQTTADTQWADAVSAGYKWRVKKSAAGVPVGFGLATSSQSGLYKAGQAPGSTDGTSIAAGYVGEVRSQSRNFSSALTLTDAVYSNITASPLVLTAGVWNISGAVAFNTTGSYTSNFIRAGISKTSATAPANNTWALPTDGEVLVGNSWAVGSPTLLSHLPTLQLPANNIVSISVPTTFYLIGLANLVGGSGTLTAYGSITAVRIA
jgi:hypothetical protein